MEGPKGQNNNKGYEVQLKELHILQFMDPCLLLSVSAAQVCKSEHSVQSWPVCMTDDKRGCFLLPVEY